jgi:hypothetical protein
MEHTIFTKDIAYHFNRELEKNIKNALFNLDIEFENDVDFYDFVSKNIIRTAEKETFKLYLKESGAYLLKYNYELGNHYGHFSVVDNYTLTATLGSIEIITRKTK